MLCINLEVQAPNESPKLKISLCLWSSICVRHPFNRKPAQVKKSTSVMLHDKTVFTHLVLISILTLVKAECLMHTEYRHHATN